MADNMQLLHQTMDNVNKLFDANTRIDERLKASQEHHHELEERFNRLSIEQTSMLKQIAILESANEADLQKEILELDKRVSAMEVVSGRSQDRWDKILSFAVQLAWVVLAAWLLTKLNLQPPAIP